MKYMNRNDLIVIAFHHLAKIQHLVLYFTPQCHTSDLGLTSPSLNVIIWQSYIVL